MLIVRLNAGSIRAEMRRLRSRAKAVPNAELSNRQIRLADIWADRSSAVVIVRRANYIVEERERASPFGMIVTIHRGALPDRSSLTDRTRPKTVDPLSFSAVVSPLYWARRQRWASLESLVSTVCTGHLD